MTSVFIPALAQTRVVNLARIRRERMLPVRGAVVVSMGARVGALDIIAKTNALGHVRPVPLARYIRTTEAQMPNYLLKKPGEDVLAREVIASKPELFGTLKRIYRAPSGGRITAVQGAWLAIELADDPFELKALYRGSVTNVMPRMGAVIEATGALVQGLWGGGGEGYGILKKMTDAPDSVLTDDKIDMNARGAVLIAGAGVTEATIRRAAQERAAGLIVGGLAPDLRALVKELALPTLVTENLGEHKISAPIFDLLSQHIGDETVINAPSVVKNGMRPEIFIPMLVAANSNTTITPPPTLVAEVGATVRIVNGAYAGEIGKLADTPSSPRTLDSGMLAWGAEIDLSEAHVFVPWDNLELIG